MCIRDRAKPKYICIYYNYGSLLQRMGRYDEADKQYHLAIKADPNNAYTHFYYGILLSERECYDEAEKQYVLALKAEPNDKDTHYYYGDLLEEMGRNEEAKKQYSLFAMLSEMNYTHLRAHETVLDLVCRLLL